MHPRALESWTGRLGPFPRDLMLVAPHFLSFPRRRESHFSSNASLHRLTPATAQSLSFPRRRESQLALPRRSGAEIVFPPPAFARTGSAAMTGMGVFQAANNANGHSIRNGISRLRGNDRRWGCCGPVRLRIDTPTEMRNAHTNSASAPADVICGSTWETGRVRREACAWVPRCA